MEREKELYRTFIDKCLQEDDMALMYLLSTSLVSADNNMNKIEIQANFNQIDILILTLEEYEDNKELQDIKENLISYRDNFEFDVN